MEPSKMEHLQFSVLHDKIWVKEDFKHNIVTTEKKERR